MTVAIVVYKGLIPVVGRILTEKRGVVFLFFILEKRGEAS